MPLKDVQPDLSSKSKKLKSAAKQADKDVNELK